MNGWHRTIVSGAVALLLAAGVGGCASAGTGSGGDTAIVVENNLVPSSAMSVYALPDQGGRRLIGSVSPGETRTLRFDVFGVGGQYRFVARTTGGSDLVSNPVTIEAGDTVRWSLASNIATVDE